MADVRVRERPGLMVAGPQAMCQNVEAKSAAGFAWTIVAYEGGGVPLPDVTISVHDSGHGLAASLSLPRNLRACVRE